MASTNNFLDRLNKSANYFGLSEKRLRAFGEGFVRGSLWLVIWGLILTVPLFITLYLVLPEPHSSIDDFARSVVATVIQAAGGSSSFSAVGGLLENSKFYLDAALRPTALTLILAIVAYKRGRNRQVTEVSEKGSESTSFTYALGLGMGFASLATAATFFISGVVASTGFVSIEPTSVITWLSMVLVLGLPAWLGGLRETTSKRGSSPWLWFYSALRTFTVSYAALIVLALVVVWLYFVITPVFAMSTPTVNPGAPAKLTDEQTRGILVGIVGVLLLLPTILFYGLSFGLGANVGLQTDIQGVNLLEVLNSFLPTQYISGVGNSSLQSSFGWGPLASSMLLVSVLALVAGTAAAYKTQSAINFKKHFLVSLFATVASAFTLSYLTSLSLAWTNRGKETNDITDGALALQSGLISVGTTASSLLLICALIALFATLGASTAMQFTSSAFPRILSRITSGRSTYTEPRELSAVVFGAVVVVAIAAAAIIPVAGASFVRAWASADGPSSKFNAIADELQKGDVEALKERFYNEETSYLAWFPDKVLKAALPTASMGKNISLKNFSKENWQVGNLDAIGTVTWRLPADELIKLTLVAEGKVKDPEALFKHPEFKVQDTSLLVGVAAGEFMTPTGKANLKVNGQKTVAGTYNALPGAYVVTTDAYKLVAATKETFVTTAVLNDYTAIESPSLKKEYEAILDKEINRLAKACSTFTEINKANCFTLEEIYNNRTDKSKKTPSEYFAFQTKGFKVTGFSCSATSADELLSASHVVRYKDCSVQMKFTLDYYKSKTEVRGISRQETYNACPEFTDAVCSRNRTIGLGSKTVEVRGDKIASAEFTSTVPFVRSAMGFLDAKDKFSIVKTFVKPSYAPIKKVVVKPAPKKYEILGYYPTLAVLKSVQTSPKVGDAYAVTPVRIIYVWTGNQWLELK